MPDFIFYDLDRGVRSDEADLFFEGWDPAAERIIFLSPHDDDVLLGAGYLLSYCLRRGIDSYLAILCDGSAGYSRIEDKDKIVEIRREETKRAYGRLGLGEEKIIRFDFPDFSLTPYIGFRLPSGIYGTTGKVIKRFREIKPTRLIVPNDYREHLDHEAASIVGSYDGPQVGDAVLIDFGKPFRIRSYLRYNVWGDFSPEDALVKGRPPNIRGNVVLSVSSEIEEEIAESLRKFRSQGMIIEGLIRKRRERLMNGRYIEVYMKFDPRPEIKYDPYKDLIRKIDERIGGEIVGR